ncbi:hypothetical protein EBZ38_00940, partial [bacterium]|nr:hypothetical protein [bacterium]
EVGVITDPERRAKIQDAGQEMIDDFGITDKFFEDESKSIIFAALASDYADLKDSKVENVGVITAHKEFLADTLVLLAGKESAYADVYGGSKGEDDISSERMLATYDKFTNKVVSSEMTAAIANGLLDDVKKNLGITADNEDQYEVRVLNVLSEDGGEAYGMSPTPPDGLYDLKYDDPKVKEFDQDDEAYKDYEEGLIKNGKDFNKSMGREGDSFAPAWITTIDGRTILCLSLTTAEKILYKDEARSSYFTEDDRARDLALLKHEYTHTQKGVSVNGEPYLGIGLEELRAEHFSGDKHGYADVKRHFKFVSKLSGFSPKDIFDDRAEGEVFDPANFYTKIAQQEGLDGLLDAVLLNPSNYIKDEGSNKLQKSINDYVGGIDGLQEKAWDKAVKTIGIEGIEANLREFTKLIAEKMDPESFYKYGGFPYIARKALELWDKEKPSDYVSPSGF